MMARCTSHAQISWFLSQFMSKVRGRRVGVATVLQRYGMGVAAVMGVDAQAKAMQHNYPTTPSLC